jgi:hypothetical protein
MQDCSNILIQIVYLPSNITNNLYMGFLSNLFNKKEEEKINTNVDFWNWFQKK